MPPTPIWAANLYGPRRVPGVRATASGCDYRRRHGESGYVTGDGDLAIDADSSHHSPQADPRGVIEGLGPYVGHDQFVGTRRFSSSCQLRRRESAAPVAALLKHLFSGDPNEPLSVRHEVVSPRTADTSGSHVERSRYQRGLAHRETDRVETATPTNPTRPRSLRNASTNSNRPSRDHTGKWRIASRYLMHGSRRRKRAGCIASHAPEIARVLPNTPPISRRAKMLR